MTAKGVAVALFDAYNHRDLDALARLYAEGATHVEVAERRERFGVSEIIDGFLDLVDLIPDAGWHVSDVIGESQRAAVAYTLTGSLTGQFGPFPSRGQRLTLEGVLILSTSQKEIARAVSYWVPTQSA